MVSYMQNELSSIWQNEKDGIATEACIIIDGDLEQTLRFPTVAPYNDFNSDSTTVSYTRIRPNKEATWGEWVGKN